MSAPLVLIDGSSWLFRAFHALPPLTSPSGAPTGAVYGMANMIRRLQRDYAPQRICVVFDPKGRTFREDLYAEYKANRGETPEELVTQFPLIRELIGALGLPELTVDGFEADDVIGTLATQARERGWEVLIVTGDKDMAQLVDGQVRLLDTMKSRVLDPAAVEEKFGVPPERIIDYLALMGDSSDNIPGVPLVGPKTAAKWLKAYGSLDTLMERADEVGGKAGENLRATLAQLPLSRQLTTIRCDVPLPLTLDELVPGPAQTVELRRLYRELGFTRWAEELDGKAPPAPQKTADDAAPAAAVAPDPAVPQTPQRATDYTLVLDAEALEQLARELEAAELICVDTETDSLDSNQTRLVGLAFAVRPGHGWYLPVGHDYLGAPAQLSLEQVRQRLRAVLEDPARPKLGQHLKFDLNVLVRHGLAVRGVAHDTMLQSYVLDATGNRHDMDTLAQKYLGHKTISFSDVAGKGKHQLSFNQIELDKAAAYSAEDADITLRLHQTLYPRLCETPALQRVYAELEMPLVPVLAQIEQNGVKVDVRLLREISAELAQRMDERQAQAYAEAGREFNLGSPRQLGEILYGELGLPVRGKTPKGEPSTAEDVLEELAAEHPLPRLILDWRGLTKLRSTYTEQLPQAVNPRTGRIHTSYHQAVAATGRLSSSDPNLQNIPVRNAEGRRIRQAFIAEPGQLLLAIDYSQIELRLMAHFSADPKLVDAFRNGQDIHQATAAEVFGLALDAVGPDQRRAAKAINFGLIYGMSAFGLAKQLGIGRAEAGEYIERFFSRYPGVKRFMDQTRETARERGYVETLYGRRLYLPNLRSRNAALRQYAERTAINAPLQGTAADLIKHAMIEVDRFLREKHADIRMIMQVHDELVFEGPAEPLRALAPELACRMCGVMALDVPLVADYGVAENWDATHQADGSVSSDVATNKT